MFQATLPCPPDRWGGTQQCWKCYTDIPIGEPAQQNEHGVYHHAQCPEPTEPTRQDRIAASAATRQPSGSSAQLDEEDEIFLAMLRLENRDDEAAEFLAEVAKGPAARAPTSSAAAVSDPKQPTLSGRGETDERDFGDDVADALDRIRPLSIAAEQEQ